jgi:hypothetical protein
MAAAVHKAGYRLFDEDFGFLARSDKESSAEADKANSCGLSKARGVKWQVLLIAKHSHPPMARLIHCSRLAAGWAPEIRAISLPD